VVVRKPTRKVIGFSKMATTRNPLQDFVLTPQQQSLLFAALQSNKPSTMSPGSNTSPAQGTDLSGYQESPYLDYDYSFDGPDSSYDFSFDNDAAPKMIGDLPGTGGSKDASESPAGDSPDKRSHPDDEEDEEENGPKRRESTEKVPKKPGRKPLTSEPTSVGEPRLMSPQYVDTNVSPMQKRKAQNRAAQRAFRERKEKHLKDLETKVSELEKASETANHENERLRGQVDKMTIELNEYKKRFSMTSSSRAPMTNARGTFGNSIFSNINDVNFQFEFPKFGQLPGPPPKVSAVSPVSLPFTDSPPLVNGVIGKASPAASKDSVSPADSTYLNNLDSQTKEDLSKFSGIFSPPLTNSTVANASRGSMDSQYNGGPTSTNSPSASSGSNVGPSSSCGTSPEPFSQSPMGFKPIDTLSTIGEEQSHGLPAQGKTVTLPAAEPSATRKRKA
jgi:AP-1-like transcription factor